MEIQISQTQTDTIYSVLLSQLQREEKNSRLYRTFAAIADLKSFTGVSAWFQKESDGELEHHKMIHEYMRDINLKPILMTQSEIDFDDITPLEMFCQSVQAENETLCGLNKIKDVALIDKDYMTADFIQTLILNQREEIKSATDWKNRFILSQDSPAAILVLDNQLLELVNG